MIPGQYQLQEGDIELCAGRERITVEVANTGDRPIQLGSHYHFAEANPALVFDRDKTRGYRLDVAAGTAIRRGTAATRARASPSASSSPRRLRAASGTAIRFEPGQTRAVTLIPFVGKREIYGFRGDVMGPLD